MRVEIKRAKEEQLINWSKIQLVQHKQFAERIIQISTELLNDSDYFSGQDISSGVHLAKRVKSSFKLFNGTLTLTND
jgi:hypothetical protein